jgi:hypothetical protein
MRCCLVGWVGNASASAADLLLVDLEGVAVLHLELLFSVSSRVFQSYPFVVFAHARAQLTISGLSVGFTLVPSNRKRTLVKDFP